MDFMLSDSSLHIHVECSTKFVKLVFPSPVGSESRLPGKDESVKPNWNAPNFLFVLDKLQRH